MTTIESLISLSRTPQPESWTATLTPLQRRAEVAALRLVAQRSEHYPVAEQLVQLDMKKLVHAVTLDALPLVGRLVAAGRELRDALDADFNSLRDSIRTAVGAPKAVDFEAAIVAVNRDLPRAENTVALIERLVTEINAIMLALIDMPWRSEAYVIPETIDEFFYNAVGR